MIWKYHKPKFEYERVLNPLETGWVGHVFFAYDLVRNTKPKRIVELGTHFGHSFFAFCQAEKDEGTDDAELVAVDTWEGDEHSGFYDNSVYNGVEKIKNTFYNGLNIRLLRKTFDEAVSDFEDNSIDILHIDGLHTYEAVKHDFDSWIGKVKKDGIILLHDTAVRAGDFGVYKLWDEIKKKYNTLEFDHSHGLGVMFKGPKHYKKINIFKEIWRHYYTIFSENKLIKFEIDNINKEIQKKDNEIKLLSVTEQQKNQNLAELRNFLQQKDNKISNLSSEIKRKDNEIRQKDQIVQQKDQIVQQMEVEINLMKSSKFWILRNRYIKIRYFRMKHFFQLIPKALRILWKDGVGKFSWATYKYLIHGWDYFKPKPQPEKPKTDYEKWVEKNEKWDSVEIEKEIEKFKYKPKISIITPVYNVDPKWLDKCIESVRSQFYENWELRLHDDASTKKETVECLKKWEKKDDKRIKISYGKENQHISGASNEALKLATGEFVALLDNDDELSPNALFENAKLINEHSEADFIYSDEDKIETNGKRNDPFFKPDWSPDLFLSQMYTCHLGVYRKSIINEIGGFRKGYEGSQDYDLVLRFIEKTKPENIFHIPKILYHWKKIPGSMARNEIAKDYTAAAAQKALKDYLVRNNIEGEVLDGKFPGTYRVKRKILGNPKISIVIPFRDKVKVLDTCVKSILEKTSYSNYEIILVDNQSNENKTADYLKSIKENEKVKLIKYDRPFNFSAINNYATKKCHGDYILFLNNDVEVISPEWLNSMVEHIQRKEVGAVGAKLLYFDNTIQHAGVVVGPGGVAGHAFKTFSDEETGYFSHHHLIKNYNVVTAACILVKKEVFEKVGSFDESNLPVAFNDVDLCLKIREAGYLIVWTPFAKLYHYESLSRGNDEDFKESDPKEYERVMSERIYAKNKWKKYIENDPYYSPNLTQKKEDFSIKIN